MDKHCDLGQIENEHHMISVCAFYPDERNSLSGNLSEITSVSWQPSFFTFKKFSQWSMVIPTLSTLFVVLWMLVSQSKCNLWAPYKIMIFEKSSYISVQHIAVNVCASEHLGVPSIYQLMSTVNDYHNGSIFGNWLLFIPVFSILSWIVLCACPLSSPISISSVCRSLCLYSMQSPCT